MVEHVTCLIDAPVATCPLTVAPAPPPPPPPRPPLRPLSCPSALFPTPLQTWPIMGIITASVSWMAYMGVYQIVHNPDSVK